MKSRTAMWLASMLFTMLLFTTMPLPALAQDEPAEPMIRKDSILASTYTYSYTLWSANFKFEVNTPFIREDRLWVDVLYPGRKDRVTVECEGDDAGENKADFRCLAPTAPHYNTAVGVVDFEIHMANELSGKNLVLFRGKMKVVKGPENAGRPADHFHVDEDWRIPIGYLYRDGEHLSFAVWWFGEGINSLDVTFHLFHEGKAIAKADLCGGQPVSCSFRTDGIKPVPALSPGAYEIKVLKEGRLKRTATFTVNEDGSFDNGIASANKLGSDKVIIPVSVVGDLPRPWNKLAWKDAFYGNPLIGFTAPP